MRIQGATALVTGANRGLGQVMARMLLQRGARRVYAGARDPRAVVTPGVIPVRLDVTDPAQVAAATEMCADVSLLVNNAGVLTDSPLLAAPGLDAARTEMEVNYFGTLAMCRAFAPLLTRNESGAIVNVLSIASWFTNAAMGSYCASKAAAWAMTNGIRSELHDTGILVVGVHCGYIDTDMARHVTGAKNTPESIASQVFDAVEAGRTEVLADERTRQVKAALHLAPGETAPAPRP
ncbi:SDR family oxidoreductase [Actinoallomurus sp. NPDC050550]|uniref:SDR family oxidoreductase n=1 Tax=Actinoallomurus sp. NPDC050550 TaxID=3154937 RepID=UPI0033CD4AFD